MSTMTDIHDCRARRCERLRIWNVPGTVKVMPASVKYQKSHYSCCLLVLFLPCQSSCLKCLSCPVCLVSYICLVCLPYLPYLSFVLLVCICMIKGWKLMNAQPTSLSFSISCMYSCQSKSEEKHAVDQVRDMIYVRSFICEPRRNV